MSGELVELRSFFLGGKTGDDAQLSESDGSSESGLERFLPRSSAGRSSVGIGEGDTEALKERGRTVGQHRFRPGTATFDRNTTHSRSAYLRFRFS